MTQVNPKQIRTSDVHALYDILVSEAEANPGKIPGEASVQDHVRQIMTQKLTECGYALAPNLSRILESHETKLKRNGGQRATASEANDMTAALYTFVSGKALTRSSSPSGSSDPQAASTPKPSTSSGSTQQAAHDTSAPNSAAVEDDQQESAVSMHMHTDFTIDPSKASMIDTTLSNITGNAVTSFAQLIEAMAAAEEAAAFSKAANASVQFVISEYTSGNTDVDESSMLPLPEFERSGYADLSTQNPMIAVLDSLIADGIKPSISYGEAILRIKNAEEAIAAAKMDDRTLQLNLRRARPKSARAVAAAPASAIADNVSVADELNEYVQVVDQLASDVFPNIYGINQNILGFDVPTLEFGEQHPNVPKKDDTFRFFATVVAEALHSIAENEIMWLYGDSGCGKSEFWGQLAARLNFPFTRMNLDGHLTRSDIIGVNRMLPNEDKQMEMRFVEGILPRAMSRPGILLLDEFDLGDPEIMPIFQPILEGNPLVLLEDGGRIVHPHPMFRIAITGNTIGLGSANQMYNNAFEQSAATRDRIASFVRMPYMTPEIEKEVVMARVPNADEQFIEKTIQLANKVRDGYRANEIHQLFSTRAVLNCARRYARFAPHFATPEDAADEILSTVILGRMDPASHQVVKGLIDNIFA